MKSLSDARKQLDHATNLHRFSIQVRSTKPWRSTEAFNDSLSLLREVEQFLCKRLETDVSEDRGLLKADAVRTQRTIAAICSERGRLRDVREAVAMYENVVKAFQQSQHPILTLGDVASVLHSLGDSYVKLKRYAKAMVCYNNELKIRPSSLEVSCAHTSIAKVRPPFDGGCAYEYTLSLGKIRKGPFSS